jgi:hypothetical protein
MAETVAPGAKVATVIADPAAKAVANVAPAVNAKAATTKAPRPSSPRRFSTATTIKESGADGNVRIA